MLHKKIWVAAAFVSFAALISHSKAENNKAEIIHWWTSPGESAALKELSTAFENKGGIWVDTAIAGGSDARSATINRILGGDPPMAAQFNTSKQYHELIDEGLLNNIDSVAKAHNWDQILPEPVKTAIKVNGHYYAAPVNIHQPTWIWYSKTALEKAGIAQAPNSMAEFIAALDSLKKANLIPLALGGQKWQEMILFSGILLNTKEGVSLYKSIFKERQAAAFDRPEFKDFLTLYKKLSSYVDAGSPGRNWNDATNLLIKGEAGFQIMGDWVKGEFDTAQMVAGKNYGCIPGFGKKSPYVIAGDVFIFPKNDSHDATKMTQETLASAMLEPATQVAFNIRKGSIPVRADVDSTLMDICAQAGLEVLKDKSRHLAHFDQLVTPDEEGQVADIVSEFWNSDVDVIDVIARLKQVLTRS